nr:unnamed protein product [Digitaria exilis]
MRAPVEILRPSVCFLLCLFYLDWLSPLRHSLSDLRAREVWDPHGGGGEASVGERDGVRHGGFLVLFPSASARPAFVVACGVETWYSVSVRISELQWC